MEMGYGRTNEVLVIRIQVMLGQRLGDDLVMIPNGQKLSHGPLEDEGDNQ